jgi:hypothetical protein
VPTKGRFAPLRWLAEAGLRRVPGTWETEGMHR